MRERLLSDIRRMRPAGDTIGVTVATDPGWLFNSLIGAQIDIGLLFGKGKGRMVRLGEHNFLMPLLCLSSFGPSGRLKRISTGGAACPIEPINLQLCFL